MDSIKRSKKIWFYLIIFILIISFFFLIPFKKGILDKPNNLNQILIINNTPIDLNKLAKESNYVISTLEKCLSACKKNSVPTSTCLSVNSILSNNKDKLSLLRNYYNTGQYRYELNSAELQLLEDIKWNIIEIDNKMQEVVPICNKAINFESNIKQESHINIPLINFHIDGKNIGRTNWLKENKSLFAIAICHTIMDNETWKDRLQKQKINLDKCIYITLPQIFDYCINANYDWIPLKINLKNVKKTAEIINGCIIVDLYQRYIIKKK